MAQIRSSRYWKPMIRIIVLNQELRSIRNDEQNNTGFRFVIHYSLLHKFKGKRAHISDKMITPFIE